MRHNYKGRKLGTDFSHTKAMKRALLLRCSPTTASRRLRRAPRKSAPM